jgi:hypothetical protein
MRKCEKLIVFKIEPDLCCLLLMANLWAYFRQSHDHLDCQNSLPQVHDEGAGRYGFVIVSFTCCRVLNAPGSESRVIKVNSICLKVWSHLVVMAFGFCNLFQKQSFTESKEYNIRFLSLYCFVPLRSLNIYHNVCMIFFTSFHDFECIS